MVGNTTVSPGEGDVVLVWKKIASPDESITPTPDEDPPDPDTVKVQFPTTL